MWCAYKIFIPSNYFEAATELGPNNICCTRKLFPQTAERLQAQGRYREGEICYAPDTVEPNHCVSQRLSTNVSVLTFFIKLDEAHNIKERATNTAKACFELKSKYKWCLSGTPLQNRVGELYSLIRFLGGDPYSYYFCEFS